MPVFDFQCLMCNEVQEDIFVHHIDDVVLCPECKGQTLRLFPNRVAGDIFPIDGITLNHVESKPVHFDSLKKMKKYAKERDLELGALL